MPICWASHWDEEPWEVCRCPRCLRAGLAVALLGWLPTSCEGNQARAYGLVVVASSKKTGTAAKANSG